MTMLWLHHLGKNTRMRTVSHLGPTYAFAAGLALGFATGAAESQELPENACRTGPDTGVDTGALNACLAKAYADLDMDLNTAYKAGFKFIDGAALQPTLTRDWKRAYQEAQRKWIAYREADCGPPVSYEWTGGSGAAAMQFGCKIARTRERLEVLKRRYSRQQ
jgi:uncharacterized protein YecT (DUF1311 family)